MQPAASTDASCQHVGRKSVNVFYRRASRSAGVPVQQMAPLARLTVYMAAYRSGPLPLNMLSTGSGGSPGATSSRRQAPQESQGMIPRTRRQSSDIPGPFGTRMKAELPGA